MLQHFARHIAKAQVERAEAVRWCAVRVQSRHARQAALCDELVAANVESLKTGQRLAQRNDGVVVQILTISKL